jgi:hypothetical protein
LKQLQAFISAALPFVATKISLLPFLNPQIADDQWPITSILSLAASGVTYNLSQRFQKPKMARYLALLGLACAVVMILGLLALVGNLMFSTHPELQDFLARSMFILLFVGIGLTLGYCFARLL